MVLINSEREKKEAYPGSEVLGPKFNIRKVEVVNGAWNGHRMLWPASASGSPPVRPFIFSQHVRRVQALFLKRPPVRQQRLEDNSGSSVSGTAEIFFGEGISNIPLYGSPDQ
ncbi:hypothetical protein NPIL_72321 [Nephila pilipes]|uniref:Uncharacterized protein n=1 Tax=Nephila pilipes TaxID=299642 RepID=A0A8X6TJ56_NEPPI|nr:hypothetical protein NPIL_72321 [Nephila pilipes]